MLRNILFCVLAAWSLSCVVGQDKTEPTIQANSFDTADKNGDNKLTRDEIKNSKLFQRMDSNDNGVVTRKEASVFAERARKRRESSQVSDAPVFPFQDQDEQTKRNKLASVKPISDDKRPPNVVLIFSDDLGYGDLGCYGSKEIPTPHIDALASSGVRFTNAYVTAASCSPSRAGLMSGRYQQRFGFEFNTSGAAITHRLFRGLDPKVVTIADVMQKAGYKTGMFGKWHLGTHPHLHPKSRGFDQFYGFLAGAHSFFPAKNAEPIHTSILREHEPLIEQEYLTDAIAREAAKFIDENHDQPFFAYVPFNAVHTPIQANKKYQSRFPDVMDETKRDYFAMTSAMDDAVGRIVKALDRNQVADNTLVIFLNDNGGPIYTKVQSNGPLKLGKLFLFEGGVRVPMVLSWPNRIAAGEFDKMASSLDVFPTICAAAGISIPENWRALGIELDGVDLLPYLAGDNDAPPHDRLYWSNGPNIAVRKGNWKLVQSYENVWLYDLSSDIGEANDLSGKHPELVRELQEEHAKWQSKMTKPAWPSKPNRRKTPVDGKIYELNI